MNELGEEPPGEESLFASNLQLTWQDYLLPGTLACILLAVWVSLPPDIMRSWAVSHQSVAEAWIVLLLHMFAHGSLVHVAMNAAALIIVGPRLFARIGSPLIAWARFLYLFLGSGIAGGAVFLLLNGFSSKSALGASGAIFGLIGALARVHPATGVAVSLLSRRSWLLARMFVRDHIIMFMLIFGALVLTGQSAMVAWEAHLGGMLFGLVVAPLFLPALAAPIRPPEGRSP